MYILCAVENGYLMAGILKSLLVPGLTESKTNLLRRKTQHKTKGTVLNKPYVGRVELKSSSRGVVDH